MHDGARRSATERDGGATLTCDEQVEVTRRARAGRVLRDARVAAGVERVDGDERPRRAVVTRPPTQPVDGGQRRAGRQAPQRHRRGADRHDARRRLRQADDGRQRCDTQIHRRNISYYKIAHNTIYIFNVPLQRLHSIRSFRLTLSVILCNLYIINLS